MSTDKATDLVRVTAACQQTFIASPNDNLNSTMEVVKAHRDSNVIVLGELSLTGYTCGDLFAQDQLLQSTTAALCKLAKKLKGKQQLVVVGLPLRVDNQLFNVAAALFDGQVLGIVPKQYLPNYQEFYEARWFSAADGSEPETVEIDGLGEVPFGIDLLFRWQDLVVGIELCEDLWMPVPPSSLQAANGANLLLNLSASNELVGKAAWRETLVRSQSGRCLAAYAYASAGPTESTTDVVFGGQCLIAENGHLLDASQRIGKDGCAWIQQTSATADIDLQKLAHDRQVTVSWQQASRRIHSEYRTIEIEADLPCDGKHRRVNPQPFVPSAGAELDDRCSEIFGIQCAALAKRVSRLPQDLQLNIGVSGGLDSTLALLVAVKTCEHQGWPAKRIHGITMPGFGTTSRTLTAARELMQHLGIQSEEIDIRELCLDTFRGIQHTPFGLDVSASPWISSLKH